MLTRRMSQDATAAALGRQGDDQLARATDVRGRTPYAGRGFVVRVLGYSGVRNSELCDLRIAQVRLHDPGGAAFPSPTPRPRPACASSR